jgi:hypothetical protein
MLRLVFSVQLYYSIEHLAKVRELTSSKNCYRDDLDFLKLRISLTRSLSNRLVYKSNYMTSYKSLRTCYINFMRANLCTTVTEENKYYLMRDVDNTKFFLAFFKTKLMRDLDYALVWRGSQINSLFNMAVKITKKKKKYDYKKTVFFIKPKLRLLFVWRWFAVLNRCFNTPGTSRHLTTIKSLENFLIGPLDNQIINMFKLQVYKLKLLRVE